MASDGGRLKLEWGTLRHRDGSRVEDLLWWEGDRLTGFLGMYGYGAALELAGMVAPGARKRGIGNRLLDAALGLCRARNFPQALLIVPRPSKAGKELARARGASLDHSEHALVLSGEPSARAHLPSLNLPPATSEDLPLISRLLEAGFGVPVPDDFADRLLRSRDRTAVVELNGAPVGTLRMTQDGEDGRIYGFVIDPALQSRGIGREALICACEQLRHAGARQIGLEVAVGNDRALGLYTSVGFTPVTTEDYYELPMN